MNFFQNSIKLYENLLLKYFSFLQQFNENKVAAYYEIKTKQQNLKF